MFFQTQFLVIIIYIIIIILWTKHPVKENLNLKVIIEAKKAEFKSLKFEPRKRLILAVDESATCRRRKVPAHLILRQPAH